MLARKIFQSNFEIGGCIVNRKFLLLILKHDSCKPAAGQAQPQNARPITNEMIKSVLNMRKLPFIMPCDAPSIIR